MLEKLLNLNWLTASEDPKVSNGLYTAFVERENPFADKINDFFKYNGSQPRWWSIRPLIQSVGDPKYSNLVLAQGIWYEYEVKQVLKSIQKKDGLYLVPPDAYRSERITNSNAFTFESDGEFLGFLLSKRILVPESFDKFILRRVGFGYKFRSSPYNLDKCSIAVTSRQKHPVWSFQVTLPYF